MSSIHPMLACMLADARSNTVARQMPRIRVIRLGRNGARRLPTVD